MKPLLTVPIVTHEPKQIEDQLRSKVQGVEAYEIWLDHLKRKYLKPEIIAELVKSWKRITDKKLICVLKSKREKGKYTDGCRGRADLLLAAAQSGAHYLDIGFLTSKQQIERLRNGKGNAKLIISWHNFLKTPSRKILEEKIQQMKVLGADVIKIATMVKTLQDNENLLQLAMELTVDKKAHIIIGMGQLGVLTRVFAKQFGNELNFVTLESQTAPGQLTLNQMLTFEEVLHS
ncbi:MAG: type I 3-dehydroquinate dehydratase [bacterium]|nr:type I 3-dehydroquinate dehydratase [bacterium]